MATPGEAPRAGPRAPGSRRARARDRLGAVVAGTGLGAATRRHELLLMTAAAGLSVAGFLGYYLPIYEFPHLLPSVEVTLPILGSVQFRWAENLWCLALTAVELVLLTLLNVSGVYSIAVATGYVDPATRGRKRGALMGLGLERKALGVARYGIDPFQGLHPALLFVSNALLRLRGFLGHQAVRYLFQLVLGRYAVRSLLDFAGLPIYMAINALSVRHALRQARVILLGQRVLGQVLAEWPVPALTPREKALLYDTLQYIAISKRDFHRNHLLLTRELLARFGVPREPAHRLPADYLDRLGAAPDRTLALCQAVILLGFVLDGHLSRRERRRLDLLASRGLLEVSAEEVAQRAHDFLDGRPLDDWLRPYAVRAEADSRPAAAPADDVAPTEDGRAAATPATRARASGGLNPAPGEV